MAEPETLQKAFDAMLEKARWCSNKHVHGFGEGGPGTGGANLAACQSCALLPEISCVHFNQALDGAILVGELSEIFTFKGLLCSSQLNVLSTPPFFLNSDSAQCLHSTDSVPESSWMNKSLES